MRQSGVSRRPGLARERFGGVRPAIALHILWKLVAWGCPQNGTVSLQAERSPMFHDFVIHLIDHAPGILTAAGTILAVILGRRRK